MEMMVYAICCMLDILNKAVAERANPDHENEMHGVDKAETLERGTVWLMPANLIGVLIRPMAAFAGNS